MTRRFLASIVFLSYAFGSPDALANTLDGYGTRLVAVQSQLVLLLRDLSELSRSMQAEFARDGHLVSCFESLDRDVDEALYVVESAATSVDISSRMRTAVDERYVNLKLAEVLPHQIEHLSNLRMWTNQNAFYCSYYAVIASRSQQAAKLMMDGIEALKAMRDKLASKR